MSRRVVVLGVCLLAVSAGCTSLVNHQTSPPWSLNLYAKSIEGDQPPYDFRLLLSLSGQPVDVSMHDIRVYYVAGNGSTVVSHRVADIGPTSGNPTRWANGTVKSLPREILLRVGEVDNPHDQDFSFQALRLQSTDPPRYVPFYQNMSTIRDGD